MKISWIALLLLLTVATARAGGGPGPEVHICVTYTNATVAYRVHTNEVSEATLLELVKKIGSVSQDQFFVVHFSPALPSSSLFSFLQALSSESHRFSIMLIPDGANDLRCNPEFESPFRVYVPLKRQESRPDETANQASEVTARKLAEPQR
jgi:hypothetical protein